MLLKDLQTLATKLATGTLFHVEKAGKAYSVDYSALAKAIIEEYADSTVGGSKQSVQAAIGALNSRIGAIAKETKATDGSVTFTFTGNRYAAILMIQSNTLSGSGIYGLIFKKGAGSSIKSLVGNESLPTIDSNGSITFNMVSWSKAILYTTSGDEFS